MAEKNAPEVLNVERWFLELKYSKKMVDELLKCDIEYIQETEKAVKLLFTSEDISTEVWVAKNSKNGPIVTFRK